MEKNYFLYFNVLLDGNRKNGFGGFPLLNLKPLTDWETPSDSISYLKIKSLWLATSSHGLKFGEVEMKVEYAASYN